MLESFEDNLSGKLLPAHLKPKDDELFSSWLSRLSLAHGLAPSGLCSILLSADKLQGQPVNKKLHLGDIDRSVDIGLLTILAEKTGTALERVRNTTLAAYEGWIYEKLNVLGNSPWVMPINSSPAVLRAMACNTAHDVCLKIRSHISGDAGVWHSLHCV